MNTPGKKLLVIDDDSLVRQSIVAYLEDSGFEVHDEAVGSDGLAWFREHRSDLILTDLRMPDMDGLTILKAVKEIDADVPVIVISGMGMVSDVAEALRLGAADYLTKPVTDMEVLVHSIRRSLSLYQLRQENNRYRAELEAANRELRESLRVLERDQKAGRQVQSNLLPPSPVRINHVVIEHKIIPSLYLSGDFVDYGVMSERYVAFYLTDVSGHGASSAFVTVWLKQLVRRMFRDRREAGNGVPSVDVAALMSSINQEMMRSKFGCHLTCFVGILDTQTNHLRYVLGGHLPMPVLLTESGAEYLEGKGKPVGIFEDATWEVFERTLPSNFKLMVLSDGILEILPAQHLIDKEHELLDLMVETQGDIKSLCVRLDIEQSTPAPDDIAILSLTGRESK